MRELLIPLCAGAISAAITLAVSLNQGEPVRATYDLVAMHEDGESDIVDYDLSATDCAHAILIKAESSTRLMCEQVR